METTKPLAAIVPQLKPVGIKEAVGIAVTFISELYPLVRETRLEEVEADGNIWRVVVSFVDGQLSPLQAIGGQTNRIFKVVPINKMTGEPQSLKVWKD